MPGIEMSFSRISFNAFKTHVIDTQMEAEKNLNHSPKVTQTIKRNLNPTQNNLKIMTVSL